MRLAQGSGTVRRSYGPLRGSPAGDRPGATARRPPPGGFSCQRVPFVPSLLVSLDDSSGGWIFLRRRRAGKGRRGGLLRRLAGVREAPANIRDPLADSGQPLAGAGRTLLSVGRTMTDACQTFTNAHQSMASVGQELTDAGRSRTDAGETTMDVGQWLAAAGETSFWRGELDAGGGCSVCLL